MKKVYEYVEKKINSGIDKVMIYENRVKTSLRSEEGIGVVEVILILVVLISLVLIFKEQLTELVEDIFEKITDESSGI